MGLILVDLWWWLPQTVGMITTGHYEWEKAIHACVSAAPVTKGPSELLKAPALTRSLYNGISNIRMIFVYIIVWVECQLSINSGVNEHREICRAIIIIFHIVFSCKVVKLSKFIDYTSQLSYAWPRPSLKTCLCLSATLAGAQDSNHCLLVNSWGVPHNCCVHSQALFSPLYRYSPDSLSARDSSCPAGPAF